MLFSPVVVAASALLALTAVAAPITIPLGKVPSPKTTTLYFGTGSTQELVEVAAQAAAEKGAEIVGFFGLPPNGHDMGFVAHLSIDSNRAISQIVAGKVEVSFEEEGNLVGPFCPEAFCHSN